jgi:hypothetical protein
MTGRRFPVSAAMLGGGGIIAAALFWSLLNVPESNVAALALSALLTLLILGTIGASCGMVAGISSGRSLTDAARRAVAALPNFVVGVVLFAALWWATRSIENWWAAHRGEIDAVFLRYLGLTRTAPLHMTFAWVTWLIRWALGLSLVAGSVAAGVHGGLTSLGRGLRGGVRAGSLAVAVAAVLLIGEGLWRLAYWRPAGLSPTWVEPTFAAVKLAVLYGLAVVVVTFALTLHTRTARMNRES